MPNFEKPFLTCLLDVRGRVVRKSVSANPGLKVNRSIDFSSIKMFFYGLQFVWFELSQTQRAEGQTVERENLIKKLQS